MRSKWLVCFLLGGAAFGQAPAKPAAVPPPHPAAVAADTDANAAFAKVAPTDPVITIKGTCEDPAKQGDACQTVVTREEFEKLAEAVRPGMPPNVRRQLATYYSRMLPMTKEAEKRALDKSPKYSELIRFARMQILSQELSNTLQQEAQSVSDADVEKNYKDNAPAYEEATMQRLFIPRVKQVAVQKPGAKEEEVEAQQKAGEETMKKTATDLRARAAKGEDFEKLQKEAFLAAGVKGNPPTTKMEKVRQSTLPQAQKSVLELKPGEVSQLISDPTGHYVYKLVSKQSLPLDAVKAEIHNALASQRYRDAMQPYQQSNMDMNAAYFGPTRNPAAPPVKPGETPAENDTDPD
jgi:hypothetical protein